jgi:hypothetical protein
MSRLRAGRMPMIGAVGLVCTLAVLGACRSAVDDFYDPLTGAPEPTSCAGAGGAPGTGGAGGSPPEGTGGAGTGRGAAGAEGGEGGCARQ